MKVTSSDSESPTSENPKKIHIFDLPRTAILPQTKLRPRIGRKSFSPLVQLFTLSKLISANFLTFGKCSTTQTSPPLLLELEARPIPNTPRMLCLFRSFSISPPPSAPFPPLPHCHHRDDQPLCCSHQYGEHPAALTGPSPTIWVVVSAA